MTFEEARSIVIGAIQTINDRPDDARFAMTEEADLTLAELDFDSMAAIELCMEVEEKTGIEIDLANLGTHPSVNTISSFLAAKSGGG